MAGELVVEPVAVQGGEPLHLRGLPQDAQVGRALGYASLAATYYGILRQDFTPALLAAAYVQATVEAEAEPDNSHLALRRDFIKVALRYAGREAAEEAA